jgi:hypothetical protein
MMLGDTLHHRDQAPDVIEVIRVIDTNNSWDREQTVNFGWLFL